MQEPVADRPVGPASVPLAAVAAAAGLALPPGVGADQAVSGVTIDSRAVRPGDLFAAVPGAHLHRADFAADAVAAGAVAV